MHINIIPPPPPKKKKKKETKSPIRCQSLLKLRNANDHVVIHFASNFSRVLLSDDTVNWFENKLYYLHFYLTLSLPIF